MAPFVVNTDGSLPMELDPETGRWSLCASTEAELAGGVHTHDTYAASDHSHVAGDHPDLAAHTALGLAASHAHDYAATAHNHDAAYAASGHAHTHNHDGTYATAGHSHPGGSEAFPVGSVFISTVATNPATLLGYGTWSAFGAGRVILGAGGGFTAGETGGAATHTHAAHTDVLNHTHAVSVTDPGHAHVQGVNSASTGGTSGYTADTSTNTRVNSGYSTSSATTGVTATTANPAGGVASLAHDSPTSLPPYIVAYLWERTA